MRTEMGGSVWLLIFCAIFSTFCFDDVASQLKRHVYDKLAPIGQLFTFQLPADDFNDSMKDYKVTEAGSDVLPDWLLWNSTNSALYGVPNHRDYLPVPKYLVSFVATSLSGRKISKIATITVVQDGSVSKGVGNAPFRSRHGKMCNFNDSSLIMVAFPAAIFLPLKKQRQSPNSFNDPKANFDLLTEISAATSFHPSLVRLLDVAYVLDLQRLSSRPEKHAETQAHNLGQPLDSALLFVLDCGDFSDASATHLVAQLVAKFSDVPKIPDTSSLALRHLLFAGRLAVPLPKKRWAFDGDGALSQWSGGVASFTTQEAIDWTTPTSSPSSQIVETEDDDDEEDEEDEESDVEGVATIGVEKRSTTTEWSTSRKTRQWTSTTPQTHLFTATRRGSPLVPVLVDFTDHKMARGTKATKWTSVDSTPPSTKVFDRRPPVLSYSLGSIRCTKNILCEEKIPRHTFSDAKDGSMENLSLGLKLIKGPAANQENWLFLDSAEQTLVGVPMTAGTWEYHLTATNSAGNSVADAFEVQVVRATSGDDADYFDVPSHEFAVGLSLPFAAFVDDPATQAQFVRRLAQNLGDGADPSNVRVSAIVADANNASVTVVRWTNSTLAGKAASAAAIARRRGLSNDEKKTTTSSKDGATAGRSGGTTVKSDGKVGADSDLCSRDQVDAVLKVQQTKLFRDRMNAKLFPFVYVLRSFAKWCDGNFHTPVKFPADSRGSAGSSAPSPTGHLFKTTVLPALIVLTLLCLALLVACLLYRKKRRSKKSPAAESPSGRSSGGGNARFLSSKGTPVIFPDEVLDTDQMLDDEKTSSHTPMLLKDEKPPLAPPDFGRLNGSSGGIVNGFGKTVDRQSSPTPYPAGYQSPLSGTKLSNKQQQSIYDRPATAAPPFDETEMVAAQRPLLQHEKDFNATTAMFDENPLYRAPPPFVDPHQVRHPVDGRTPNRNATASPQTRQPPPFVTA